MWWRCVCHSRGDRRWPREHGGGVGWGGGGAREGASTSGSDWSTSSLQATGFPEKTDRLVQGHSYLEVLQAAGSFLESLYYGVFCCLMGPTLRSSGILFICAVISSESSGQDVPPEAQRSAPRCGPGKDCEDGQPGPAEHLASEFRAPVSWYVLLWQDLWTFYLFRWHPFTVITSIKRVRT